MQPEDERENLMETDKERRAKKSRNRRVSAGKISPESITEHESLYKYQTIQSFRPDEVKELLTQHFARIRQETTHPHETSKPDNSDRDHTKTSNTPAGGGTALSPQSLSEDGKRRFSLVRSNLRYARKSVKMSNSNNSSTDSVKSDDVNTKYLERHDSSGTGGGDSPILHQSGDDPSDPSSHRGKFMDIAQELDEKDRMISQLREQLSRERLIHSEELNRMREKQKKIQVENAKTTRKTRIFACVGGNKRARCTTNLYQSILKSVFSYLNRKINFVTQ